VKETCYHWEGSKSVSLDIIGAIGSQIYRRLHEPIIWHQKGFFPNGETQSNAMCQLLLSVTQRMYTSTELQTPRYI